MKVNEQKDLTFLVDHLISSALWHEWHSLIQNETSKKKTGKELRTKMEEAVSIPQARTSIDVHTMKEAGSEISF